MVMDARTKEGFQETNSQLHALKANQFYFTPLNGRYRVENAEVNSYNGNYGPYYGNHGTYLGDYPLNFTTLPSSAQSGHMLPFKARLEKMDMWWRTNNSNIVTRLMLWKQLKVHDTANENNTLLWESGDITAVSGRSYRLTLGASEFDTWTIDDGEMVALSLATITNDGTVKYFYIMAGGAWWYPA